MLRVSETRGGPPLRSGPETRFRALYELHASAVARYAARRVPIDDVHDVLSETFLTAWRKLDAVPEDAVPWLFATARRHKANRNRSTRRRQALSDRLINAHAFGEALHPDAESVDIDRQIVDAIRRLPAGEREALMLVAWDGLDPKRAAIAAGLQRASIACAPSPGPLSPEA